MDEVSLLQLGPESFRVLRTRGAPLTVHLSHATRRGLGLQGVAPVVVATEIVRFLLERGALPDVPASDAEVSLGPLAGAFPEFVEELRARLG